MSKSISPKTAFILCAFLSLLGCTANSPLIYSSSNDYIEVEYNAYGVLPTVTPKAKALADIHCRAKGKAAVYAGVSFPNIYISSAERHRFNCIEK